MQFNATRQIFLTDFVNDRDGVAPYQRNCFHRKMNRWNSCQRWMSTSGSTTRIRLGKINPSVGSGNEKPPPGLWKRTKTYWRTDPIPWASMPLGQKGIHLIRSSGYFVFIASGLSLISYAVYTLSQSMSTERLAWSSYEAALEESKDSLELQRALGIPIQGFPQDSTDSRIRGSLQYALLHLFQLAQMDLKYSNL